ncbi:MAG: hypothetical protein ACON5D_01285 [Rubripirellula sp.]
MSSDEPSTLTPCMRQTRVRETELPYQDPPTKKSLQYEEHFEHRNSNEEKNRTTGRRHR